MPSTLATPPGAPAGHWRSLVPFLAAVTVVAVVGSLAAGNAPTQYDALEQPSFAPPAWLFGPVWTVLYLMMAVAGWLLWRAARWSPALGLWTAQLVLNLGWTPLFFAADLLGWALLEICALWVLVAATLVASWRHSRTAALLLAPYLAWVSYAAALNAALWRLN